MNTCKKLLLLYFFIFIWIQMGIQAFAKEDPKEEQNKNRLSKVMAFDPEVFAILNINNLWMWEKRDGKSNHSSAGNDGVYFPRGTTHVIYQDGMVWGAKAYLDANHTQPAPFDQTIRVGGSTYGTGCQTGWINGQGTNAVAVTNDPRARIYRIRRDWKETFKDQNGYWTDIARQDGSDSFEIAPSSVSDDEIQLLYDQFQWCWDNWPVELGAPFIDRNGNGIYDPPPADFTAQSLIEGGYDEPGIAGADLNSPADMVIWNVYNDLNRSLRFGSEPIGLEIQNTVWGYDRRDALGNTYFRRIKIINKGGVRIDFARNKGTFYLKDMYVTQWSDPDVGDAGDDLVGCDTHLSLGFAYNGNEVDNRFASYWLPPPAVGYDFLQGPALPSPGNVAVFDLKYKQDYKNLGMTGFSFFSGGSPYSDPSNSDYNSGAIIWYKMMRGFAPLPGDDVYYSHPLGVQPGPFPLSGDPVKSTGHLDGLGEDWSFVPGDRRLLCNTGPFQMAPGDTQEVATALVCGLGGDRLSSISVLKYNDRATQSIYNSLFSVPKPPKSPSITIAELNDKIILEWGSDIETVEETENRPSFAGGYRFEGYNVYQLPKADSQLSDAVRIATFDLETDPAVILDEQIEPASGKFILAPVQYGSNSGIRREFVFDRDYINDVDKIYNGTDYYLVVTAYSVSTVTDFVPRTLESNLKVLKVVPQSRGLGEIIGSEYGQIIDINHSSGSGNAKIMPMIIEPLSVKSGIYTVSWDADSTWKVSKDGSTLADGFTNYSGDEDYPIIHGVQVKAENVNFAAPLDFTEYVVLPSDNSDNYDIDSYYANGWADNATSLEVRGFGINDISFLQNDIELQFTGEYDTDGITIKEGTGSIATFIGARNYEISQHPLNPNPGSNDPFTIRIPFEIWDVERDLQINILIYDRIQTSSSIPFYAFNPTDRMYCYLNSLPYQETALDTMDEQQNSWNLVFWKTDWQTGDIIKINYANPIIPGVDEFTYSTMGLEKTMSESLKKQDLDRIGVFPNPYYAFNPLESSYVNKFVTFNNLPPKATIRIFNLAGHLVNIIKKDNSTRFERWDLLNLSGLSVASGIYIAHIEMPEENLEKVLKLVIIMEAEFLEVY